jgi:hypothetical protein
MIATFCGQIEQLMNRIITESGELSVKFDAGKTINRRFFNTSKTFETFAIGSNGVLR